ncbi:UNVERIFIED_CONTAM: hypothetical protein RMT77_005474 [Armadillidium vulgare]
MLSLGIFNALLTNNEINLGFQSKERTEKFIKESVLSEKKNIENIKALKTSCSKEAENLGPHQKVISYSFLNKSPSYSRGLNHVMKNVSSFFPDWKVRIYALTEDISYLKSFMKNWSFVYFCDINKLPAPIYSLWALPVTMWRFAPLGDDQVDVVLSRDLDSLIIAREYDAVSEWLNSTSKSLHIIRDHPHHSLQIMGGTWGMRMNESNRKLLRRLRDKMFKKAFYDVNTKIDQPILKVVLWPAFKNDFLAHDSYHCDLFPGSVPFPTRRDGTKFIGDQVFQRNGMSHVAVTKKCPLICRPKDHQDWEYC